MKEKKYYFAGIWLGIIAIVSALLIINIPFGNNYNEMTSFIVFTVSSLLLILLSLLLKNKWYVIIGGILVVINYVMLWVVELTQTDYKTLPIGFLIAFILGTTGLVRSIKNRTNNKVTLAVIFNSFGIILSILALVFGLTTM